MVVLLDVNGIQSYVSESSERILGYKPEELINISVIEEMIHPDDQEITKRSLEEIVGNSANGGTQYRHRHKNGSWVYLEAFGNNQLDNPALNSIVLNVRDITERKQAERELIVANERIKNSENYLDSIINNMGDPVFVKDSEKRFYLVNDAFCKLLDLGREEILGKTLAEDFPQDEMEHFFRIDNLVLSEGIENVSEEMLTFRGGQTKTISTKKSRFIDTQGEKFLIGIIRDITERKQAEKALHVSGEKYKALFNSVSDAIFTFDPVTMEIIEANEATSKLYGYDMDELLGMSCLKLSAEVNKSKAVASTVIKEGLVIVPERHHMRKDGSDLYVELDVYQVKADVEEHVFTVCRDITKRKQFEDRLRQSQKLESIGTMAGGIAHELNNILQSMFLYSGIVDEQLPDDKDLKNNFNHIQAGAEKARDIVKQILTFSRKSTIDFKPQVIHEIVMEALALERASLPANIVIKPDIDMNCGMVRCDETQINQIVINLCNNASHAMQEKGGELTVSLQQAKAVLNDGGPEVDVLELKISDTGCGIKSEELEKIFDPFFTTKEVGKGTGLGLSVVHGIVKMTGGKVLVSSELGKGSAFSILLPVTEGIIEEITPKAEPRSDKQTRSILLVDDEDNIRNATQAVLTAEGFLIDSASDGKEALDLFKANPIKYDLVVTDLSMPRMSGLELTMEIRKSKFAGSILLSTGHLGIQEEKEYKDIGITAFIQKPWTAEELIDQIHQLDHLNGPIKPR